MVKITIDGLSAGVAEGTTILSTARGLGISIPTLCHNDRLKNYGGCGLCSVEAEGRPKLLRACSTLCADGMNISTRSRRVVNARKTLLEFLLSEHTGECRPPCVLACPAETDCRGYVAYIAKGEYSEAVKLMKDAHPLPASIGRVCPHPCETECRRSLCEEPINISGLKCFAADFDLAGKEKYIPVVPAAAGKSVAVVGGGPAGLTAAYFLKRMGHKVAVYESMPQMGGLLRYGIPEYRLPKSVLDAEIETLLKMGIEFINNFSIGRDISLEKLRAENDAIIVATGAGVSKKTRCPGEDSGWVWGGIDFLKHVAVGKKINLGRRVAVTGGSNTAIDAARTALRMGAEEVFVLYRRTRDEMPAEQEEIHEAENEGVDFKFLVNPIEIKQSEVYLQRMTLGEPDASGRRSPVPVSGMVETISIDTLINAVGQDVNLTGLESLKATKRGALDVNPETFQTSIDGVFAIGDVTGLSAYAIDAIGHARKAASAVQSYLSNTELPISPPKLFRDKKTAADFNEPFTPRETHARAGLTGEQAKREASRCLSCGCGKYHDCDLIKYSNEFSADLNAFTEITPKKSKSETDLSNALFTRDPNKCVLCGLCARYCQEIEGRGLLGIAHRGLKSVVGPAFGSFSDADECEGCGRCVSICPTGALQMKSI